MAVTEILPDLFFIQRGYLNGNHFVYRAEEPMLIDTAYLSDFVETERLITGLGVDLSRVRMIVNTHCHCDHIGGNRRIQEKSGCEIAMHEIGKYFIDSQDSWATWWRYYLQEAEFFECGIGLKDGDCGLGRHRMNSESFIHRVIPRTGSSSTTKKRNFSFLQTYSGENDLPAVTVRCRGQQGGVFAAGIPGQD